MVAPTLALLIHGALIIDRIPSSVGIGKGERSLFSARRPFAVEIEKSIRRRNSKIDPRAIFGVLLNAWCETHWNPTTVNSNHKHYGIFQYSGKFTAARKASLLTIAGSVSWLMSSQRWGDYLAWLSRNPHASMSDTAYRFAHFVERPAHQHCLSRRKLGKKWETAFRKNVNAKTSA